MATLSDEEREAVALRYGGEMTAPEMAELLGEKLTTVEGRVYRALAQATSRAGLSARPVDRFARGPDLGRAVVHGQRVEHPALR